MSDTIQKIDVEDIVKAKDKFVILWRAEEKQVAQITSLDLDQTPKRITYVMVTGPEKGERFSAQYDASLPINVFETLEEAEASITG